jgi:hypothetical protein
MTRWRCPICGELITKPQLFPIRHPKTRKWVGAYHRICMEIFSQISWRASTLARDSTTPEAPSTSILWVSALARSPRIACAWVELNMILPSDCAKVFRAKNFSADHIDAVIRVYDGAGNVIEMRELAGDFKEL